MRFFAVVFTCYLGLSTLSFASDAIFLTRGSFEYLPAKSTQSVNLSIGGVIRVKDEGHRVKIIGQKIGQTQITIGKKTIAIYVVPAKSYTSIQKLLPLLGKQPQIALEKKGSRVSISTTIDRPNQIERILQCQCGQFVELELTLSPVVRPRVRDILLHWSRLHYLPEPKILFYPSFQLLFSGTLSKSQITSLESLGLNYRVEKTSVAALPMVDIQLAFFETNEQQIQEMGLNWPTQAEVQILPNFDIFKSLTGFLGFHASEGRGHLHAHPRVLVRSHEKGTLHWGGELPIVNKTFTSQTVQWKKYGLIYTVSPTVGAQGNIHLQMELEMSTPDFSYQSSGVPGLSSHSLQTKIDLLEPQPFLLASLKQIQMGQSSQGLPFLHKMPGLNNIFGSSSFKKKNTEIYIFVHPRVRH